MKARRIGIFGASLVGLSLLGGCASAPPRELLDARAAYASTSRTSTSSYAQADVYEAKKALDAAEASFDDDGDSMGTRDLAYVAQRKALSAKARGETAATLAQRKQVEADLQKWKDQQATATRGALDATKGQLAEQQRQLESERQARAAAEAATASALQKVEGLQQKLDDKGRTVLTLNGSILFQTGKSELLASASQRLRQVVEALKNDERSITIVGHTDSVGNDDKNMELSQKRAESVKGFLVSHGIPEERVKSMGMGESQPIADNGNAEGRANNRRVEIVLDDPAATGTRSTPGATKDDGAQPRTR
ncbi:MAG: OmpA family protein [Deltaproteobacteria bacterium]|nr:OmpA family protein [Deltaproteobacteria bacterium]